jgi:hypothetical protein
MRDGQYAYKFNGSSMADGTAYHLVGIGLMKIAKGKITGEHRSSIVPLKGTDATLTNTSFKLTGTAKSSKGGFSTADITFKFTSGTQNGKALEIAQTLTGTFDFASAGKDRYWLISSGARNKTLESWAAEVVSGELIRIGD